MTRIAYDDASGTEISDEGGYEVLHIYGFPDDIIPAVNKYNREHRGPDGNAINITQTCIDALRSALKARESHTMQDTHDTCVRDENDVKIVEGDVVSYVITGPDAYAEWEGKVVWEHGKFVIKSGEFQFDLDDTEVLRLKVVG